MSKLARRTGYATVVLTLGLLYAWSSVWPPEPAGVPVRGGTIANVTLIEPGGGRRAGKTVHFEAGLITAIDDSGGDGSGGYVTPGLIDMHVHQPVSVAGFEEYFSLLYLMHGVTTVRDLGYSYPDVFERRSRIEAGKFPGPRIFTCGTILDGDPPLWDRATVVPTPADAEPIVTKLAAEGADCIKIYTNLRPDVLSTLQRAAHAAGLPVVGHIPANVPFEDARLDDVQHLIGVPDQADLPKGHNPFASGWAAMSVERTTFVAATSVAQRVAHTPTLVFLDYNSRRDRPDALVSVSGAEFLPRVFPEVFWQPAESFRVGGRATPELYAQLRRGFEAASKAVAELHRQGVVVHAGTDAGNPFVVPGVSLQQELRLLVQSGLTPEQSLAAATTIPGESLRAPLLGRLEVGAPADMLVLGQDPTASLDALASLRQVVADGRIYRHADLQREVERYRGHYHNVVWNRGVTVLARLFAD